MSGSTHRRVSPETFCLVPGILLLLALAPWQANAAGAPPLEPLLPEPAALGASEVTPLAAYDPENLYELIDGQATAFLAMGFVRMATRDYRLKAAGGAAGKATTLSVRIYDMGTRLKAFGAFSQLAPPRARPAAVGAAGAFGRGELVLCQDRFYVTLGPPEGETLDVPDETLLAAGKAVAAQLPGPAALPKELDLLPRRDREPGSESFLLTNALGLSFLHDTLAAEYRLAGHAKPVKLFVSLMADATEARAGMEKLAALIGETRPLQPGIGDASFEGTHAYFGQILCFRQGRYLVALPGVEQREAALGLLREALTSQKKTPVATPAGTRRE